MRKPINLAFSFIFIFSFASCTHTVTREKEHTAMGEIAELALFSDPLTLGTLSGEIQDCFAPPLPGLYESEPAFKVRITKERALRGYHKKNYVLFILVHRENWDDLKTDIDLKFHKTVEKFMAYGIDTSFKISDAWAEPQKVVFCVSKNIETMGRFLTDKKEGLFETALKAERESTIKRMIRHKKGADDFFRSMKETRGYAFRKPFNYDLSVKSDEFIGFNRYISDKRIGVYTYSEPYRSRKQFSKDYIINKRNKMVGKHLHGPERKDSITVFMTTDNEDRVTISSKEVNFDGLYAIETRGWWTMENGFMGGPFLNYTIYSEKLKRVVTIEGNIFAPNRKVARYLREIELIAHTYED